MEDYRSWGATRDCHGCRHWSEMIALADENGLQAMCLAPKSEKHGQYTGKRTRCDVWEDGHLGATDQPGGNPYDLDF